MGDRPKILLLSNNFPNPAELNRGIFNLQFAKELQKVADLSVATPLPWFPKWLRFKSFRKWIHFSQVPYTFCIDGVNVHSPKYLYLPKIAEPFHALMMFLRMFPWLVRRRRKIGFDIIIVHWLYPDGVCASWYSRLMGVPLIMCAEGCDVNEFLGQSTKRIQILSALNSAAHIATVSNGLTQALVNHGIAEEKITTIPNGVDSAVFSRVESDSARQSNNKIPTILYIGRLSDEKDVMILLQAVALLRNSGQEFRLNIVGDGPEMDSLRRFSSENSLDDRIQFAGQVAHRDISNYLRQCDVLCLPSKREGCPNVVLEAMACGVPVVAFAVGGIPDMVSEATGILAEERTPESLQSALQVAIDTPWNNSAIANSVRDLTWERVARKKMKIVEKVLT